MMPAWLPVNDTASTPSSARAMHKRAMEKSARPELTSMSYSRGGWTARRPRPPKPDQVVGGLAHGAHHGHDVVAAAAPGTGDAWSATARIRSASPTEVPPNFCTSSGTARDATPTGPGPRYGFAPVPTAKRARQKAARQQKRVIKERQARRRHASGGCRLRRRCRSGGAGGGPGLSPASSPAPRPRRRQPASPPPRPPSRATATTTTTAATATTTTTTAAGTTTTAATGAPADRPIRPAVAAGCPATTARHAPTRSPPGRRLRPAPSQEQDVRGGGEDHRRHVSVLCDGVGADAGQACSACAGRRAAGTTTRHAPTRSPGRRLRPAPSQRTRRTWRR